MNGRVNILLPTHNGTRYLPALLESLSTQEYQELSLSIRDDCSTDDTYAFLLTWFVNKANVSLCRGERLGVMKSFFYLLVNADTECDYFAFCDQDDVWLPGKIVDAVSALEKCDPLEPVMYCSRVAYVDANLHHIGYSKIPRRMGFANALVENVATGCTVVLNRAGREILVQQMPRDALMHDWWCYLVLSAVGKVVFDSRPNILYRQHGKNAMGVASNIWGQYRRRVVRFSEKGPGNHKFRQQALEFSHYYRGRLKKEDLRTLERFLTPPQNVLSRVAYAARADLWRQSWVDDALLRILICMDRI